MFTVAAFRLLFVSVFVENFAQKLLDIWKGGSWENLELGVIMGSNFSVATGKEFTISWKP